MGYMPLMIDLKRVVVFGGTEGEGRQKAEKLSLYAEEVLVVPERLPAPSELKFGPGRAQWSGENLVFDHELTVKVHGKAATIGSVSRLVEGASFVCSDLRSRELNLHIVDVCKAKGIYCNVIDTKDLCNAWFMSHIDVPGMLVAISSKGGCAFYARTAREELEPEIARRGKISTILADFRAAYPKGRERMRAIEELYLSKNFQTAITANDWETARKVADAHLALAAGRGSITLI